MTALCAVGTPVIMLQSLMLGTLLAHGLSPAGFVPRIRRREVSVETAESKQGQSTLTPGVSSSIKKASL